MRPEDLLARLEAGYEYDPMYGQLCNERDKLKAENAKLRLLVEGMATYERMDIDADPFRALEIKEAIGQLASELGIEV